MDNVALVIIVPDKFPVWPRCCNKWRSSRHTRHSNPLLHYLNRMTDTNKLGEQSAANELLIANMITKGGELNVRTSG